MVLGLPKTGFKIATIRFELPKTDFEINNYWFWYRQKTTLGVKGPEIGKNWF